MQTRHGSRAQEPGIASVQTPKSPGPSLHVCPTFVQTDGCASSAVRRHEEDAMQRAKATTTIQGSALKRAMPRAYPVWGGAAIVPQEPSNWDLLPRVPAERRANSLDVNAKDVDTRVDRLLRTAIAERRLIQFRLEGLARIAEPHDYGILNGTRRLFVYQIDGASRSGRLPDWRWVMLDKATDFELLDRTFPGPRPVPSAKHQRWDRLLASVSRPTLRLVAPTNEAESSPQGPDRASRGRRRSDRPVPKSPRGSAR
jgi:hypothetical protein